MVMHAIKWLKVGDFFVFRAITKPTIWKVVEHLDGTGFTVAPFITEGGPPALPIGEPLNVDPEQEITTIRPTAIRTGGRFSFLVMQAEVLTYTELETTLQHLNIGDLFQLQHTNEGVLQIRDILPSVDSEPAMIKAFPAPQKGPRAARLLSEKQRAHPVGRILFQQPASFDPITWDFAPW